MIVLSSQKLVILLPPRTGAHSLIAWLVRPEIGGQIVGGWHGYCVPREYADYAIAATVRDPFSRAVSLWRWYAMNLNEMPDAEPLSFAAFVRRMPRLPPYYSVSQTRWLRESEPVYWLRCARLSEEVMRVPGLAEIAQKHGPPLHLGASGERSWWRRYSATTARRLARWWADDVVLWEWLH